MNHSLFRMNNTRFEFLTTCSKRIMIIVVVRSFVPWREEYINKIPTNNDENT